MLHTETKPDTEESLHQEIKALREVVMDGKRTREEFASVLEQVVLSSPLSKEQIEGLVDALYPLFKTVELSGKTVVIEIPHEGAIPDDLMMRYCAYVDVLKGMGALSAVFVKRGFRLEALSDRELERYGLRRL